MSGYPQGGYPGQAGFPGSAAPPPGYQAPGGYGGASAPPPYGGPPQVDQQTAQWFNAVDQDKSGQITAKELQQALMNGNMTNFSEEACRMMIDLHDADKTGTIDIAEFQRLFSEINKWKTVFESFDKDRSGQIEQTELTLAFQQMGYRFSPTFVGNLLVKYDPRSRRLTLDNFIVACVQIQRLTNSFRTRDREMRGQATLAYEDFIGIALGAHN